MLLDYRNGQNVEPEIIYSCYNDLGSAITAGDVYMLSYEKDVDSLDPAGRPTLLACATTAIYRKFVVALEDVADASWGKFMYKGTCYANVGSGVAIDDYIQGANASQEAADDGTTMTTDSFGIAVTDYVAATGLAKVILFGERALIG